MHLYNFDTYCQISLYRDYTTYVFDNFFNPQRHHIMG